MPGEMWFAINGSTEAKYDVFRYISVEGTKALYSINAADKARAVPFIRIHRVDRDTNKQLGDAISDQFVQVPNFGVSLGTKFGERPPVSIDNVNVKNHMPQGWIQWRDIDINITVHRPDVLNGLTDQSKVIAALLTPGNTFVLTYGWRGGQNGILGPGGNQKEDVHPGAEGTKMETAQFVKWEKERDAARKAIGVQAEYTKEPEFYKTIYTARDHIRFVVTHYNFSIQPDNQIKLTIHAKEDGTLNITATTIFENAAIEKKLDIQALKKAIEIDKKQPAAIVQECFDYYADKILQGSFKREFEIPKDPKVPDGDKQKTSDDFIELQLLFNVLFAEPIVRSLNGMGYSHVHLYFGAFQNYMCKTQIGYDGGLDYSNMSIGEFLIRTKDAVDIIGNIITTGGKITINNLMEQFRGYLERPSLWDLSTSRKEVTSIPEVQVFTIFNPETGYARIQLSDRKRYITLLHAAKEATQQNWHVIKRQFRDNLQSNLAMNFIPYFTLFHQSSFFQDAKFEITQDERMRSLFIQDRNNPNRSQIANSSDSAAMQANFGIPAPLVLYRSAVKGTIKMIGNFVFSYAGHVWINFNINDIDGLFYVMQKVDEIGRDGFTSTYTFQAEGTNPVGAKPGPGETANDAVREKYLVALEAANFIPTIQAQQNLNAAQDESMDKLVGGTMFGDYLEPSQEPWEGGGGGFSGGGATGHNVGPSK